MGLNIKNERVCALAREVAARSGQNQTAAIESALERYLAELLADTEHSRRQARVAARKARIDTFLATLPAPVATGPSMEQIDAEFYDAESGLPR